MDLETKVFIRIVLRYILMAISFGAVACIFYSFTTIFTKHKLIKYTFTVLMISICIFLYITINNPNKVIRMKEDVLYILPKK